MRFRPDEKISGPVLRWYRRKCERHPYCFYCGVVLVFTPSNAPNRLTKDHIYPKVRGGKNGKNNMVWSCRQCNELKGHMILGAFRRVITGLADGRFFAERRFADRSSE